MVFPEYVQQGLSQNKYHVEKYGKLSEFGYKDFLPLFTGDRFDPESWAELMRIAGVKYGGIVTEHADNFSLWDSKINPVNAVNYGPKRDVVGGELEKAIRAKAAVHRHVPPPVALGWFMSTDPNADVYDPPMRSFTAKRCLWKLTVTSPGGCPMMSSTRYGCRR